MTRRFPRYCDTSMAQALDRARQSTGWPDDMSLMDMAAHILAGHDADDAAIADVARQITLMMERA